MRDFLKVLFIIELAAVICYCLFWAILQFEGISIDSLQYLFIIMSCLLIITAAACIISPMTYNKIKQDELIQTKDSFKFDISRVDFYQNHIPELKERTEARLTEIAKLGMEEVMNAEFGIKGVVSGLYIEMIWSYSEKEWTDYINWLMKVLIINKP